MNLNQKPKLTRRSLLCILFLFGAASLLILLHPAACTAPRQTGIASMLLLQIICVSTFMPPGSFFPISLVLEEVPTFLPCPTTGCSGRMYFYRIFYLIYPLLPSSRDMQFLRFSLGFFSYITGFTKRGLQTHLVFVQASFTFVQTVCFRLTDRSCL